MSDNLFFDFENDKVSSILDYLINIIITSRVETGLRSNSLCLDEDVNIYMANLLKNYASAEHINTIEKYICLYESDLVAKQENSTDLRERYQLYKNTADYIFFTIGIFHGFSHKLSKYKNLFRLNNTTYIARSRSYYCQAAEYIRKLKRGTNGPSEVMDKLSEHFNVYLNIMFHAREKYFNFIEKFSDGEWFHFVHKNIIHKKGVNSKVYVELMDTFLVHLSSWKKTHNPEDRDMIRIIAAELKRLNPKFNYNVETLISRNVA
jgi:hypothetical protein